MSLISIVRRRPVQQVAGALLAVAALTGGVLAGVGGATTSRMDLLEGSAWLPSTMAGQVALISGPSAEPIAAVAAGAPGDDLSVVQSGADAYVVNRTAGTVSRIDGATFTSTKEFEFAQPSGAKQLQVFTGGGSVFVLDGARGVLWPVDPKTLVAGAARSLSSDVVPGSAEVDDTGRLWVVDRRTGDLKWFDHSQDVRQSGSNGATLVLAAGAPVLVDTDGADWLSADGSSAARVSFDLRAGERAQVSGTADGRLILVVAARGIVKVCDRTSCDDSIYPLSGAGSRLGPALFEQGLIFVPDLTYGTVHVLSTVTGKEIATPDVLKPTADFQLFLQDTVVFYNDPASDRAGVLNLDGTVDKVQKYHPDHPDQNLDITSSVNTAPVVTADPVDSSSDPSSSATPSSAESTSSPADRPVDSNSSAPSTAPATATTAGSADGGNTGGSTSTGNTGGSTSSTTTSSTTRTSTTVKKDLLTVSVSGTGQVTGPGGTSCPGNCTADLPDGSPVTLTAVPPTDGSWNFTGWTGSLCHGTVPCKFTMSGLAQVGATFARPPPGTQTLTVDAPAGGTVASSEHPPLISCPTACSHDFVDGSTVTLTETTNTRFSFSGWTGDGQPCGQAVTCGIPIKLAKGAHVGATFVALQEVLTVGVLDGTITSSPAGIACSNSNSPCQATFPYGTTVVLTGVPDIGHDPVVWISSLNCPNGQPCPVTMTRPTTAGGTFVATMEHLSLQVTGNGSVSDAQWGISCAGGQSCPYSIQYGSTVNLSATAQPGSDLPGWGGDKSCLPPSNGSLCQFIVDGPVNESANFGVQNEPLVVRAQAGGTVTGYNGAICDANSVCSYLVPYQTSVSLVASPVGGVDFVNWLRAPGCTTSITCNVVMTGSQDISAVFATQGGIASGGTGQVGTNVFGKTDVCVTNLDSFHSATFTAVSGPTNVPEHSIGPSGQDCGTLNRSWVAFPVYVKNTSASGAHISLSTK